MERKSKLITHGAHAFLTSAFVVDGPWQAGAIAGRPAHDHWRTPPSSGRIHPLFACDDCAWSKTAGRSAFDEGGPFFLRQAGGRWVVYDPGFFSPPEFFRTARPSHRSPEPLARALRQKCGLLTGGSQARVG